MISLISKRLFSMEDPKNTFVSFCASWEGGLRTLETEILRLHHRDVWQWQMKWNGPHTTPLADPRLDLEAEWQLSYYALSIFAPSLKTIKEGDWWDHMRCWLGHVDSHSLGSWHYIPSQSWRNIWWGQKFPSSFRLDLASWADWKALSQTLLFLCTNNSLPRNLT